VSHIPVILCTGYSQLINQQRAVENGIKALVMKPILINDMADAIRKVLNTEGNQQINVAQ
jgi:CheY-like chemotaxis protein